MKHDCFKNKFFSSIGRCFHETYFLLLHIISPSSGRSLSMTSYMLRTAEVMPCTLLPNLFPRVEAFCSDIFLLFSRRSWSRRKKECNWWDLFLFLQCLNCGSCSDWAFCSSQGTLYIRDGEVAGWDAQSNKRIISDFEILNVSSELFYYRNGDITALEPSKNELSSAW